MFRSILALGVLLSGSLAVTSVRAADPAALNPLKIFAPSPLSAEFEVYSGAITGKNIGAAYHSVTRGDYGLRFTFGFLNSLDFSLGYLYSNQTRSFRAVTPASGALPSGTALLHAGNLNMVTGNGEFNLIKTKRAVFYLSPGVGYARNAGRNLTLITPLGVASAPALAGSAVTFNLGTGIKIYPLKHFGIRFDLRDHVSQGGTGDLNQTLTVMSPVLCPASNPSCKSLNVGPFFGKIPIQNNLAFTMGLIFRIL